jgi:arylsulfatase A-like enzyme
MQQESGQLDNTLVIFIMGDNGASAEGGLQGTTNEIATNANGVKEKMAKIAANSAPKTFPGASDMKKTTVTERKLESVRIAECREAGSAGPLPAGSLPPTSRRWR